MPHGGLSWGRVNRRTGRVYRGGEAQGRRMMRRLPVYLGKRDPVSGAWLDVWEHIGSETDVDDTAGLDGVETQRLGLLDQFLVF